MYSSVIQSLLISSLFLLPATAQQVITLPASTTIIIPASTAPPSPQYTEADQLRKSALNSTNTFRFQHNATDLVWNDTIADYAKDHVKPCKFAHTHGPYGENLAQGYPDITSSIDGWGNERKDYSFDEGKFDAKTGHFTAMVWKTSTDMGCGAKECGDGGWLLFCEYWPMGNIIGSFKEQVQRQVTTDVPALGGGAGSGKKDSAGTGDAGSAASIFGLCNKPILLVASAVATVPWLL